MGNCCSSDSDFLPGAPPPNSRFYLTPKKLRYDPQFYDENLSNQTLAFQNKFYQAAIENGLSTNPSILFEEEMSRLNFKRKYGYFPSTENVEVGFPKLIEFGNGEVRWLISPLVSCS